MVPVTTPDGFKIGTFRRPSRLGRQQQLLQSSDGVILATLNDVDLDDVSWRRFADKHDSFVCTGQSRPAVDEFFNGHLHGMPDGFRSGKTNLAAECGNAP